MESLLVTADSIRGINELTDLYLQLQSLSQAYERPKNGKCWHSCVSTAQKAASLKQHVWRETNPVTRGPRRENVMKTIGEDELFSF